MGEYATYRGRSVKIGTCEDMYYLRADQAHMVGSERGSLDPKKREVQKTIRFRFPWPDEDGQEPGMFDPYERGLSAQGVTFPEGLEHHTVQFVAQAGYNLSIACPESREVRALGLTIHRNGFAGQVQLCQQGYREGVLAAICKCGGCGVRFNLPTFAAVEPLIVAIRAEGDRMQAKEPGRGKWYQDVADRVMAGYGV